MRSDKFLLLYALSFCMLIWSPAWGWLPVNYWTFERCFWWWIAGYPLFQMNNHIWWFRMARSIRRSLRRIGMPEDQVERQVKHWVTDRKKPRS